MPRGLSQARVVRRLFAAARDEMRSTMTVPNDAERAHGDFPHMSMPEFDEIERVGRRDLRLIAIGVLVVLALIGWAVWSRAHAHWKPEYADASPAVRDWYEHAQLTPAAAKRLGFQSCCAHADVVKTQFRVNRANGGDQWWWLDGATWKRVPDDIIHWGESAPDGQPTLFAVGETPTCFYPGNNGN
jgi:hypothetical protein